MADGSIEVRQFDPLTLTVESESMLPVTYRWYRDANPVPEEDGGNQATLMVYTARPGAFQYHAEVANELGHVLTRPYEITVSVCPRRIFQGRKNRLSSPATDCSLEAAFDQSPVYNATEDWHLNYIAVAHAVLNETDQAFRTAARISDNTQSADAYRSITDWLVKNREFEMALHSANKILDTHERISALLKIALVLNEEGSLDVTQSLIDESLHLANQLDDPYGRRFTLTRIATAQAELANIPGALQTVQSIRRTMPASKMSNSRLTFERKKLDASISFASREVARARIEAMDYEGAKRVARQLSDPIDSVFIMSQVASSQARTGNLPGATRSVAEAVEFYTRIEDVWRHLALPYLSLAFAEADEVDSALQYANALNDTFHRTSTIEDLIYVLLAKRNVVGAERAAQLYEPGKQRVRALCRIAVAAAESDDHERARRILDEAVELSSHAEAGKEQVGAWSDIFVAQTKMDNKTEAHIALSEAKKIAGQLGGRDDQVAAWTYIAVATSENRRY